MLQLKNISKSYTTGDFTQIALDNINLNFRQNEFVAILGQSGSGKTTCLNIVGGLDQYDSGDLVINERSTKNFKDSDWDAYRNNSVGFIFQSYNLINHLSIMDNVELGMTLSGVSSEEKHRKALEVLDRVGLKDHVHKKPNQLSGGQMQRVAIARALANDPDIILADEPTGALDTQTSGQIMDLIKEISDDKLVIMVTHNPELAEKYADRIVNFQDGTIVGDSNPYDALSEESGYHLKKTSMNFFTALKLSGRNIATKKWRTLLTAFASSIGIIGIALILSLSSGFQIQIDKFQEDALSEFPIIVSQSAMRTDEESLREMRGEFREKKEFEDSEEVYPYNPSENEFMHKNSISEEYIEYLNDMDPAIINSIGYTRLTGMNLLRKDGEKTFPVTLSAGSGAGGNSSQQMGDMSSMNSAVLSSYPETVAEDSEPYLEKNYDLLSGKYPNDETDLVLVVDNENRVGESSLKSLGFDVSKESLSFESIVGTKFKLVSNDNYYQKTPLGNFVPRIDYESMYASSDNVELRISGIVRLKEDVDIGILGTGLAYSDALVQRIIDSEDDSEIVLAQRSSDKNVITLEDVDAETKKAFCLI